MMDESVEKKISSTVQKANPETTCKELVMYLINGMKNSSNVDTACEFLYSSLKNFFGKISIFSNLN